MPDPLYVGYAAGGTLAAALCCLDQKVRRLPVTGPMLGLAVGAVLGPSAMGLLVVPEEARSGLLGEVTRALLAVSLMGVALRYPVSHLRPVLRPVVLLVALAMPLAAVLTGALAALLLGLPVALAAVLGACLSPTHPVLASGVVTGAPAERDLPARLRQVLTEESGSNDGLAFPLVLLALAPLLHDSLGRAAVEAAYQVGVAVLVAVPLGVLTGRAVEAAERRDETSRSTGARPDPAARGGGAGHRPAAAHRRGARRLRRRVGLQRGRRQRRAQPSGRARRGGQPLHRRARLRPRRRRAALRRLAVAGMGGRAVRRGRPAGAPAARRPAAAPPGRPAAT